jgi:hypothetical protein
MFKVLFAPFDYAIDGLNPKAHSALVWESRRRIKLLTGNIVASPDARLQINLRMEVACECLNEWSSFDLIKEMIRSIYYTNAMGAEIRAEEARVRMHSQPFFYSFKGHGSYGADAWD